MGTERRDGRAAETGGWPGMARRDRLREVYRRHARGTGVPVDIARVRSSVVRVADATLEGWRALSALDLVELAEAGAREDFEELEFLVSRGLFELNGIKNIVALARHLA